MVLVVIPALLLYLDDRPLRLPALPYLLIAALLIADGLLLMARTISLFGRVGRGTLAPWDQTTRLVAVSIYRYVRNPMISGVILILLGEVILFRSPLLVAWFIAAVLINALYIPLVEEPRLERRFGSAYIAYKANVPRWLPRLRPWQPAYEAKPPGDDAPGGD
jgi:protein-S-isoprenylcysteine O-methyltransferase Ste14